MPSALFETRFFIYFFASPEPHLHRRLTELMRRYTARLVSAITLFEIYKLSLEREGRDTAETRVSRIAKEFKVVPVDASIAIRAAELKHATKVRNQEDIPMADSLIAATSLLSKAVCVTDSPHLNKIRELKCRWI